jgi:hypothetical protein
MWEVKTKTTGVERPKRQISQQRRLKAKILSLAAIVQLILWSDLHNNMQRRMVCTMLSAVRENMRPS